jgi:hypothetical protein
MWKVDSIARRGQQLLAICSMSYHKQLMVTVLTHEQEAMRTNCIGILIHVHHSQISNIPNCSRLQKLNQTDVFLKGCSVLRFGEAGAWMDPHAFIFRICIWRSDSLPPKRAPIA